MISVLSLTIYPVKGMAGVSVPHLQFDGQGLVGDRRWMLVDAKGKFLTQRQLPAMGQLQPAVVGAELRIVERGGEVLVLPLQPSPEDMANELDVELWGERVKAVDMGLKAQQWLSEKLGRFCRLVWMPPTTERQIDLQYADRGELVSFADGFPLLLISQAAVDQLAERLQRTFVASRFRPNILIGGAEAHAEDGWQSVQIGAASFRLVKPCSRCVVPTIDPDTLEKQPDVWKQLKSYRDRDGKIYFGQNLLLDQVADISVGDPLTVLATH